MQYIVITFPSFNKFESDCQMIRFGNPSISSGLNLVLVTLCKFFKPV